MNPRSQNGAGIFLLSFSLRILFREDFQQIVNFWLKTVWILLFVFKVICFSCWRDFLSELFCSREGELFFYVGFSAGMPRQQKNAAKPHLKTASSRERSENARRQTRLLSLFLDESRRVGIFIGAPFQRLSFAIPGVVRQTDSKGVLWRVFAYFRLVAKVSARPGTRGKAALAETPCGGTC